MKVKCLVVHLEGEMLEIQASLETLLMEVCSNQRDADTVAQSIATATDRLRDMHDPLRHLSTPDPRPPLSSIEAVPDSSSTPPLAPKRLVTPRREIEWERARLSIASKTLNECRLCAKTITQGQPFRAPDSNPTARAHDDCIQRRADAEMQRGES